MLEFFIFGSLWLLPGADGLDDLGGDAQGRIGLAVDGFRGSGLANLLDSAAPVLLSRRMIFAPQIRLVSSRCKMPSCETYPLKYQCAAH